MKIDIDASCLEGKRAGVGRYLSNLLRQWASLFPENEYRLYFRRYIPDEDFLKQQCFTRIVVPCPAFLDRSLVWENIFLPHKVSHNHSRIFFSPSYVLPLFITSRKQVVQIFDVSFVAHPEWYPLGERWYYQLMTPATIRHAHLIITGSEFSRKEIVAHFPQAAGKVKVIYLAVEDKFRPADKESSQQVAAKYHIEGQYILYVGLIANRRNIPSLLAAFQRLLGSTRAGYKLVIVGQNRSYPRFEVGQLAASMGLASSVIHFDYVAEEDMVSLYRAARLFIYPSAYEGFGLPPLEAMACGVPTITSAVSSLPEVVGEAAYLLKDPADAEEMSLALEKVLSDSGLRAGMTAEGRAQAGKFSWERCARQTMQALESL